MTSDKRKFMRFNVPIIIEYKPPEKPAEYSWGLTGNLSCEGFNFESSKLDFEQKEPIELKLKFPQKGMFISVMGNIIWKKHVHGRYLAGVKLKDMGKATKSEFLKRISEYGNIPVDWFLYCKDPEGDMKITTKENPEAKLSTEHVTLQESSKKIEHTGIKKQYLDPHSDCKVTFRLPKDAAPDAQSVTIAGDFNNWNKDSIAMKKLESGDFTVILKLTSGREYRFKYLIDGKHWENDWKADKYVPNTFGSNDSVVVL